MENRIAVEFDDIEILKEWKNLVYEKYGHSGIKKRVQELITKDLEFLRKNLNSMKGDK